MAAATAAAECVNPAIVSFIVLSRELGCIDDTATDEEQYEKIVYYYPETTPISRQLQTANMCEGLIDFSTRFAENEDVDTVVMKVGVYGIPYYASYVHVHCCLTFCDGIFVSKTWSSGCHLWIQEM